MSWCYQVKGEVSRKALPGEEEGAEKHQSIRDPGTLRIGSNWHGYIVVWCGMGVGVYAAGWWKMKPER